MRIDETATAELVLGEFVKQLGTARAFGQRENEFRRQTRDQHLIEIRRRFGFLGPKYIGEDYFVGVRVPVEA